MTSFDDVARSASPDDPNIPEGVRAFLRGDTKMIEGDSAAPFEAAPAASAAKPQAAQAKVMAKFVSPNATKVFKLDWPLEFEGTIYDVLTARVMRNEDVVKLRDLAQEWDDHASLIAVMCDAPIEVTAALASDDTFAILKEARPFMPRQMRELVSAETNTSNTLPSGSGKNTQL